ncbi:MAG: PepSY domain-containing protein [Caulobacteraceae bacterium]
MLAALVIAGAACLAWSEAGAQPFGRAFGQHVAQGIQVRNERREERGRGGERGEGRGGERGEGRGGYRAQPYAPAPRGYAYPEPEPGYRYPQAPPPQAYAPPPAYAPPRTYGYAPGAPNSLGPGWRPQQPEARRQGNVPLGQVMNNIRRGTPGRLLDAGVEPGPDGRPTYRVRWAATGGRRIDFIVDAATGAIIGQSGY